MRYFIFVLSFVLFANFTFAQKPAYKKRITPDVYKQWKSLSDIEYTADGQWVSWSVNPAKGDGWLYVYNTETGKTDSVARGYRAAFSPDGSFMAFLIKPQYDTLRNMKLRKVKKSKLPKDSLGIFLLGNDSLIKIPKVKRYELADTLAGFVVYESLQKKKKTQEKNGNGWWIFKKKNKAKPGKKNDGANVYVYFPSSGDKKNFSDVDDYQISYDGRTIAFVFVDKNAGITSSELVFYEPANGHSVTVFNGKGSLKNFTFDRDASRWAFLFAGDTAKENKVFDLYFGVKALNDSCFIIADTTTSFLDTGFCPSVFSKPYFSKDGSKLYFGIAPVPQKEPEDTLLPEEKYSVDVWNYKDDYLQPQQKLMANREKKRTYDCVFHIDTKNIVQLETPEIRSVRTIHNGNGKVALGVASKKYGRKTSWDGYYADYYIVNVIDGSRELVLEDFNGSVALSAGGAYLLYFNRSDSSWYSYDIKARRHTSLTKGMDVNFYNEENDVPALPYSYGIAGWYKGDKYVVINDKYDLWLIDPAGRMRPQNLTGGYGRNNEISFRALRLNRWNRYFNDENPHMLRAFDHKTKESGYFNLDLQGKSQPQKLIMSAHRYYPVMKPEKADILLWRRMSFTEYPDLWISETDFSNTKRISNANPQQKDYLWGTVELVKWKAFDGQELEGLLYKPEDFDSTLRYPMIVYFYEKYSDQIHNYYSPKPSHSVIGFTEYVSRGYIVFVPDITYKVGHPAKSAYNAVVSGTRFMMKKPWIDTAHIGIQGQSWGGYQVAMLVTMTDIYACAEAGAPVSNMTSAYGGIRWGSGMSRAFQYEKTQSRIGYSLWDSLDLYIENSPLFFADRVKTPLLIMHNDKDGAVPWYQGIEYFNALRRLDKKVWMLSYNNDGHNLMKWPNRVDLSIRMMQFFDHYLKGKPMPEWMESGIPATEKGKKTGY